MVHGVQSFEYEVHLLGGRWTRSKTENGRLEIGQILESQIRKQKSRIGQFNLRFLFSGLRYKEGSSPSRLPQHKIFNNEHIEAGGVERLESIARSTCDRLIKVVKRCVQ